MLTLLVSCAYDSNHKATKDHYFDQAPENSIYPRTNYCFSNVKRDTLVANVERVLDQSYALVEGRRYHFRYSHPTRVKQGQTTMKVILFLLENPFIHGDKIALIIPAKPDDSSICRLYSLQTGKEYGFGCTQEHFQPQGSALSIYAESLDHRKYMAELYVAIDDCRRIMQLGSVHFYAKNKQNSQVNIGMLNPFADFPASFCPQALILGGTSYIELAKVIDNFAALGYVIEWLDFDQSLLGSIDEGLNLYSGLMIRDRGISTRLKASKRVASGGTHLFISGNRRRIELSHPLEPIERTKRLGVHSWKGQSGQSQAMISARALPLNHESHAEQATFYQRMLGESGRNFYLLTLQAAAPEQMYYFRIDEAKRHGLITEVAISSTALSSTGSAKL